MRNGPVGTLHTLIARPRLQRRTRTLLARGKATSSLLKDEIRSLMRESAQPVAVVTTFLPPSADESSGSQLVHGATLSSFSSISLSPPLLSFAIQTPSRLSESLHHYSQHAQKGHFVLNLLAIHQAKLAHQYAQPGLEPFDLDGKTRDGTHPLEQHDLLPTQEAQGVPRLAQAVGAFACRIVDQINLSTYSPAIATDDDNTPGPSVLYIAEIMHVFGSAAGHKPLLYYRQTFVQPDTDNTT